MLTLFLLIALLCLAVYVALFVQGVPLWALAALALGSAGAMLWMNWRERNEA